MADKFMVMEMSIVTENLSGGMCKRYQRYGSIVEEYFTVRLLDLLRSIL